MARAAPQGSGPHVELQSAFLQAGGPCGQRSGSVGGRVLQRAASPLSGSDCVFPCLSPDEESSQKFIPFVGVSTTRAAVTSPAVLPLGRSAVGRLQSADVMGVSSRSRDTVQNLLHLELTTCLRIPPTLKSVFLHRVGSELRPC